MTNLDFLVFTVYSVLLLTCTPGRTRASFACFAQLEAKKNHLHIAQVYNWKFLLLNSLAQGPK